MLRPKEAGDAIPRINEVGDDLILRLKDVVAKEGSMVHDFGKWTVRYGGEGNVTAERSSVFLNQFGISIQISHSWYQDIIMNKNKSVLLTWKIIVEILVDDEVKGIWNTISFIEYLGMKEKFNKRMHRKDHKNILSPV